MFTVKNLLLVIAGTIFAIVFSLVLRSVQVQTTIQSSSVQAQTTVQSPPVQTQTVAQSPSELYKRLQDFLVLPSDQEGLKSVWVAGSQYNFLATGEQTGQRFSLFNVLVPPGVAPPLQIHKREDQALYVLEGELTVQMGDQTHVATPGASIYIPKNRPFTFKNLGTTPVKVLALATPAGIENFYQEVGQPVTDKSASAPRSNSGNTQAIANDYGIQTVSSGSTPSQSEKLLDFVMVPTNSPDRPTHWVGMRPHTILLSGKETGGQFVLFDIYFSPGNDKPPRHLHDREDEVVYVQEGELTVTMEDKTVVATAGQLVYLPKQRLHQMSNSGTKPVKMLEIVVPAGFENFIAETYPVGTNPLSTNKSATAPSLSSQPDLETIIKTASRYGLHSFTDSEPSQKTTQGS